MCKASVFDSALWAGVSDGGGGGGGGSGRGSRVSTGGASRFAAAPTQRAAPHKSSAR